MLAISHTNLGGFGDFGDFRSDLVSKLAIVLGQAKAEEVVTGFENLIKQRAKEGAQQAIPQITSEVEARVKGIVIPVTVGAIAISAAAGILSVIAVVRSKR